VLKFLLHTIPVIIVLLFGYFHRRENLSLNISIEINKTTKEKVCGLLKDMEFLRFHPCIKEIKFIEKTKIENTSYDIYEYREEAEVLMGLYKFQTKNKLYVEKIDDCKIRTRVKLPILSIFEVQYVSEIHVEELKKDSFKLVRVSKISGIYYVASVLRYYTKFFNEILFEKIKIFLESQV